MPRGEPVLLTPEPGSVVGEKYRILRLLGEGGMGAVYEAENTLTLKRAAIKWLHPRLVAVEEAGKRLLHEARAMARVRHHNVVDIYDVVIEQSSVFLVMELLIGEQLSERLQREPPLAHELVALLLPAMRGVAAAHAAGVVHRDIKPDNILLVREPGGAQPTPKVIDFGISRLFEPDTARLTRSGMTMGTPRYVSYEQLRGTRDVDRRADVYAFGVILFECLLGQPPYDASTLGEQAISFVTTEPPLPRALRPELPAALEALLVHAVARDREQRTPDMETLIDALLPFADPASYERPMRCHAPRLPSPLTPIAAPDQTTAAAASTPIAQELDHACAEVAPSLPSPHIRPGRARWLYFSLGAALVAVLAIGLTTRGTRPAAPRIPAPVVRPAAQAPAPAAPPALPTAQTPATPSAAAPPPIEPARPVRPVQPRVRAKSAVPNQVQPEPTAPMQQPAPAPIQHRAGPMQSSEF